MSDIGRGLNIKLQASSSVTNLCGTRGYPDVAVPNPASPFYVYHIISYEPAYNLAGCSFAEATIQVACFAEDRDSAQALRDAVRGVLSNYRGAMGSETVHGCTIEALYDDYYEPTDGSPFGWFVHSVDFRISYLES